MNRDRVCQGLILLAAVVGLAMRLPNLERRPMHTDEAVQAVKTGELVDSGRYVYDPHEYHGPTLQYISYVFVRLSAGSYLKADETDFRMVPVVFGTVLIVFCLGFGRLIGWPAAAAAAAFIAISPAMTFYSRYYIHEMLLVVFSAAAYLAWSQAAQTTRRAWPAALAGVCTGLMFCTKETWVIAIVCGMASFVICRWRRGELSPADIREAVASKAFLVASFAFAVTAVVLFTSFFSNPVGIVDALATYARYLSRASGEAHRHPAHFYLRPLLYFKNSPGPYWSEGFITAFSLAGVVGIYRCRLPDGVKPGHARFLAVYTGLMLLVYSGIPYKTPWCMLGFFHGITLLAGIGVACAFEWCGRGTSERPHPGKLRILHLPLLLLLAAGMWHLWQQSNRTNGRFAADRRNPYVYAHTNSSALKLRDRLFELSRVHKDGTSVRIHFFMPDSDFWPMPWYLRSLTQIGYWTEIPTAPKAPIIIVGTDLQEELEPRLKGEYHTEYFGLRPGVNLLLYVEADLWGKFIATR